MSWLLALPRQVPQLVASSGSLLSQESQAGAS